MEKTREQAFMAWFRELGLFQPGKGQTKYHTHQREEVARKQRQAAFDRHKMPELGSGL